MTPVQSRIFFGAFAVLAFAVTVNALRQPPRSVAFAVNPSTTTPVPQPAVKESPVPASSLSPVASAKPVAKDASVRPAPRHGVEKSASETARTASPGQESVKTMMIGKVSEPVRIEGKLPAAAVVGQLPLPNVADGDRATVLAIQKALIDSGFGPQIANGTAGPLTRAGIMAFEYQSGLALTGEASETLLKRLRGEPVSATKRAADAGRIATQEAEGVVLTVQKWLQTLGHGISRIDGRVGGETEQAIRSFEASIGAPSGGRISATLFGQLAREVGARAEAAAATE